jgi:hypothetical protein
LRRKPAHRSIPKPLSLLKRELSSKMWRNALEERIPLIIKRSKTKTMYPERVHSLVAIKVSSQVWSPKQTLAFPTQVILKWKRKDLRPF